MNQENEIAKDIIEMKLLNSSDPSKRCKILGEQTQDVTLSIEVDEKQESSALIRQPCLLKIQEKDVMAEEVLPRQENNKKYGISSNPEVEIKEQRVC